MRKISLLITLLFSISTQVMATNQRANQLLVEPGSMEFEGWFNFTKDAPFSRVKISYNSGELLLTAGKLFRVLTPKANHEDAFYTNDDDDKLLVFTFIRDKSGKIKNLKLTKEDMVYEAKKEFDLSSYRGLYKFPNDLPVSELSIWREGDALDYRSTPKNLEGVFKPVAGKPDTYMFQDGSGMVVFKKDPKTNKKKLTLKTKGKTYEAIEAIPSDDDPIATEIIIID